MINNWQEFFDGHAPHYMENPFVTATVKEVDFLLDVLEIAPGASMLDVGCGTGRHSVELARRGYKMTGVDISSGMLAEAERAALAAGVRVRFIQCDATRFTSDELFDAAVCLCEGAFSLTGVDEDPIEHDAAILSNISASLKPNARFVLTCLNGFKKIRQFTQADVESGKFDPITLTELMNEIDLPQGKQSLNLRERGYLPQDLINLFRDAGMQTEHIWGGTAGNWGRRQIELDEFEIMAVGRKM